MKLRMKENFRVNALVKTILYKNNEYFLSLLLLLHYRKTFFQFLCACENFSCNKCLYHWARMYFWFFCFKYNIFYVYMHGIVTMRILIGKTHYIYTIRIIIFHTYHHYQHHHQLLTLILLLLLLFLLL